MTTLNVSHKISRTVNAFSKGTVFCYSDLQLTDQEYLAASKALERMVKKGRIIRYAPGIFFKKGRLNKQELMMAILDVYMRSKGSQVAYKTGPALYREKGWMKGKPQIIRLASRERRVYTSILSVKILPVKSYAEVSYQNEILLQLLDVIKDFKMYSKELDVRAIIRRIRALNKEELVLIVKLALAYPPRARALLGAILQVIGKKSSTVKLKRSINPLTMFNIKIDRNILPTVADWNIKPI